MDHGTPLGSIPATAELWQVMPVAGSSERFRRQAPPPSVACPPSAGSGSSKRPTRVTSGGRLAARLEVRGPVERGWPRCSALGKAASAGRKSIVKEQRRLEGAPHGL